MLRAGELTAYGSLGLPLALASLPLYVFLPQFYAADMGVPIALAGAVLLAMRLLAACADPLIGLAVDRTGQRFHAAILIGAPLLAAGFAMLFVPPALQGALAAVWMVLGLTVAYAGHGLVSVAYQGWGAALADRVAVRAQLPAVREGFGLVGVIVAAWAAPAWGYLILSALLALTLLVCVAWMAAARGLHRVVPAQAVPEAIPTRERIAAVAHNRAFRSLFLVLIVNGTASAIPATLFMFFTTDYLQLGANASGFLVAYFCAAACSLPMWTRLAARFGEVRSWLAGMVGSALVFVWAGLLTAGDAMPFLAVCIGSGLMLGADLALPSALLAGVIRSAGHAGIHEAAYFGAWNWGVQLTLALAAGAALPLLAWAGYVPGSGAASGALLAAYCLLPCVLKLMAAVLLWRAPLRNC